MSECKSVAIKLSAEEFERLNAEANRLNVSTEDLVLRMVQSSLDNLMNHFIVMLLDKAFLYDC